MARKGAEFIFRGVDQVSGEAGKVVKSLGKVNKRQKTVARELAGLKRIMTGVTAAFCRGFGSPNQVHPRRRSNSQKRAQDWG